MGYEAGQTIFLVTTRPMLAVLLGQSRDERRTYKAGSSGATATAPPDGAQDGEDRWTARQRMEDGAPVKPLGPARCTISRFEGDVERQRVDLFP